MKGRCPVIDLCAAAAAARTRYNWFGTCARADREDLAVDVASEGVTRPAPTKLITRAPHHDDDIISSGFCFFRSFFVP